MSGKGRGASAERQARVLFARSDNCPSITDRDMAHRRRAHRSRSLAQAVAEPQTNSSGPQAALHPVRRLMPILPRIPNCQFDTALPLFYIDRSVTCAGNRDYQPQSAPIYREARYRNTRGVVVDDPTLGTVRSRIPAGGGRMLDFRLTPPMAAR